MREYQKSKEWNENNVINMLCIRVAHASVLHLASASVFPNLKQAGL